MEAHRLIPTPGITPGFRSSERLKRDTLALGGIVINRFLLWWAW